MLKSSNGSVKLIRPTKVLSNQQVEVISWMKQVSALRMTVHQERSQKGDSGCASEKLGVPHLLSD